jgi:DNA-binding GntR family transcriptional regulator
MVIVGIVMLVFDDYITDVLMRDLVGHDRRPVAFLIYLWLTAESGRRAGAVRISYVELAEATGVSKSSTQAAVAWLVRRKLLSVKRINATAVPEYTILTPWKRVR